jgi:hypothetical protein
MFNMHLEFSWWHLVLENQVNLYGAFSTLIVVRLDLALSQEPVVKQLQTLG